MVVIRSLAIVLVVVFHTLLFLFFGNHFPATQDLYLDKYYNVNNLFLQFRMPLFLFISGYLFSHLENDRGKYKGFKNLIKNKFKRLIIPFYVFSAIFMMCRNYWTLEPFYSWAGSHLWFITMLFWSFVFTRLQSFVPWHRSSWWIISLAVLFTLFRIYPPFSWPVLSLNNFVIWYIWFYVGYNLYFIRESLYEFLSSKAGLLLVCLLAVGYVAGMWYKCNVMEDGENTRNLITEGANLCVVILLWFTINFAINHSSTEWVRSPIQAHLNRLSYGIYVFHACLHPLIVSNTAKRLFHLPDLATHTVLFPIGLTAVTFISSMAVSWLLLKTRIGRFLIG